MVPDMCQDREEKQVDPNCAFGWGGGGNLVTLGIEHLRTAVRKVPADAFGTPVGNSVDGPDPNP